MGVGAAYNQGLQVSFQDGLKFTAFCNNDLYFSKDWLEKLETRLEANPQIAMMSPLRPSAKVFYDTAHTTNEQLARMPETSNWRLELQNYIDADVDKFDEFCERIIKINSIGGNELEIISFPDSLSTCVCMASNEHFKKIGHFADTTFTNYGGEDIDMSWTIMKKGLLCAVDHKVYVHHFRGKSLKANGMNRRELLKKSNQILYKKWKSYIYDFLESQRLSGVSIDRIINEGHNSRFWLLNELNEDMHILEEYQHESV
jgi:GT2 family glycosyltransferase